MRGGGGYAAVAAAVLTAFFPVAAGWGILQWDTADQDYPYRYFLAEARAAGQAPLWNPYLGGGFPVHADPQSEFWYMPVRALGVLFGRYTYPLLHFEFLLTLVVAGWGMTALCRRRGLSLRTAFVAGAVYATCGFFVSNAQHFVYMIAGACLPWLWVCVWDMLERPGTGSALRLGLWGALFVTGAYPAFVIVSVYMFAAYLWVERRKVRLAWWGAAFVVALVLSAGYLYSVMEARPYFSRGGAVGLAAACFNPLPPAGWLTFVAPFAADAQSDAFGSDRSMTNAYFGLGLLSAWATAAWHWRRLETWERFGLVFGLAALLAAAGNHTPVREALYRFLPGFDLFRHPGLLRIFFLVFAIPTAAAYLRPRRDAKFALVVSTAFLLFGAYHWNFEIGGDWKAWVRSDDFWGRMTLQAAVQWVLALALLRTRWAAAADVAVSALLLQFMTVLDVAPLAEVQARLNNMPAGFPCPDSNVPIGEKPPHLGPLWRNINVYYKQPYFDLYGAFKLNDYERFKKTQYFSSAKMRPWAFVAHGSGCDSLRPVFAVCADFDVPAARADWRCTRFAPTQFRFRVSAEDTVLFVVNQTRYPGWEVEIDGWPAVLRTVDEGRMAVFVPDGEHGVEFFYRPVVASTLDFVQPLLWFWAVVAVLWIRR